MKATTQLTQEFSKSRTTVPGTLMTILKNLMFAIFCSFAFFLSFLITGSLLLSNFYLLLNQGNKVYSQFSVSYLAYYFLTTASLIPSLRMPLLRQLLYMF